MPDIRVAVFDDHPLMRQGIVQFIAGLPGMRIVAEGGCAASAVHQTLHALPDIVILDLRMPGGGGLAAIDGIRPACPDTKILMLSMAESEEDVRSALRKGACGWVSKLACRDELSAAIHCVLGGRPYISPSLAATFIMRDRPAPPKEIVFPDGKSVTGRERNVLDCVAQGLSNKEIAQELSLSDKTVRQYLTRVLTKLQVRNRVEAALVLNGAGSALGR